MSRFRKALAGALTLALVSGCAFAGGKRTASTSAREAAKRQIRGVSRAALTAGTAKVEITPRVGTPLAGYSKRGGKPSTGIRDPLFVRVLAINDGEDTVVLVSADMLLFPRPLADEIFRKISRELKIPRRAVILSATHTHSGPGAIANEFLYEVVFGRYDKEIADGIVARVTWAVKQAVERQQPVRWGYAEDKKLLLGIVENRMIITGPVDPSLGVLAVEDADGKPIAVVVGAAAHPTVLDSKDMRFSADFPGALAKAVEDAHPGAVCLFFNGASGDLRPRDDIGSNAEERIERFGGALAEGVAGLLSRLETAPKGNLAAWGWQVPLPPPQLYLGPIPVHPGFGQFVRPVSTYVCVAALDELLLVPLEAELTTELGQQLKKGIAGKGLKPLLAGYSNGYLGYAVTPEQYKSRKYEAWMTWYGSEFGEFLIDQLHQLADLYSPQS